MHPEKIKGVCKDKEVKRMRKEGAGEKDPPAKASSQRGDVVMNINWGTKDWNSNENQLGSIQEPPRNRCGSA